MHGEGFAAVLLVALFLASVPLAPSAHASTTSTTSSSTITVDAAGCVSIGATPVGSDECDVPSAAHVTIPQGETIRIPKQMEFDIYGAFVNRGVVIVQSCCFDSGSSFAVFKGSLTNYGNLTNSGDFGIAGQGFGPGYNGTVYNYGTIKNELSPGITNGNVIVNEANGSIANYGLIGIEHYGKLFNSASVTNYGTISLLGIIDNEGSIMSPSFDSTTNTCRGSFNNSGGTLSGNPIVSGCAITTATTATLSSTSSSSTPSTATSSSTSSSSTPSTASTTTRTSSTTPSSSATGQGSGGIPEFPYQPLAAAVLTILVLASYLVIRRNMSGR